MIDLTFRDINILFVLFLEVGYDPEKDSFDWYFMPIVEIKGFNVFVDNKSFLEQPIKSKQEAYEKLVLRSRNHSHATENVIISFVSSKIL